jgi:primosomal protein N' (replication factor Y)
MPIYLEIAVNIPQVSGTFHYHLPPELEDKIGPGHLVEIPFGRQTVQGIVLREVIEPEVAQTRAVSGLFDPEPVFTLSQLSLARELAESTFSPLASIIGLMLPPGLGQMADVLYSLTGAKTVLDIDQRVRIAERLVNLLQNRGPLRSRQIDAHLRRVNWRVVAQRLIKKGILTTQAVLPPPTVKPKTIRTVQLACSPETAEAAMPDLGRIGTKALNRRQSMLRFLIREPEPVDVAWAYAESGGKIADLHFLAERGLVILGETEIWRDPLAGLTFVPSEPLSLTQDQQKSWVAVRAGLQSAATGDVVPPFLLHGVTGSGKTEIYLQAVDETLRLGRQAIVLVPEIALTPQTVRRFVARFPGQVGLVHSSLSQGERYDTWRRARAGLLAVVVGPRSALFTPFTSPGLIVVDECHDDSYYQSDPPFYNARQAAILYARLSGAVCLLGSATPDIVTRSRAEQGIYHYLSLPARVLAHREAVKRFETAKNAKTLYRPLEGEAETIDLPPVHVVDMRKELKAGNTSMFSRDLQSALGETLRKGQQAILFLNRRGTATYVFCRDCGKSLQCPRCDLPLTLHLGAYATSIVRSKGRLTCHHCGYERNMPDKCPTCGSSRIRQYGTGTEKVEAEVHSLFPRARTLRWDYETTRLKGAHEIILSHFSNGRSDVLIGTQMIAKGLDLPLVTLVGVVLADVGMTMPDYRAAERTFNVLTQVAGRAGRSPLGGQVLLQTFQPDHYVIQTAAQHDYNNFYREEMLNRRKIGYPPFGRLVRLEYRHNKAEEAESAAKKMAAQLRSWIAAGERRATEMIGPVPCFFSRLGGLYRWQIILRGPDPSSLLKDRNFGNWRVEVEPVSLL